MCGQLFSGFVNSRAGVRASSSAPRNSWNCAKNWLFGQGCLTVYVSVPQRVPQRKNVKMTQKISGVEVMGMLSETRSRVLDVR